MSRPDSDSKTTRKPTLRHDQRGRALDSTSRLLKKLDLGALRQSGETGGSDAPRVEAPPHRDRTRDGT
jgi:hypothetical protein